MRIPTMALYRPSSAFLLILPLALTLGCNSAGPLRMFSKARTESTEQLASNASSTDPQTQPEPQPPTIDAGSLETPASAALLATA